MYREFRRTGPPKEIPGFCKVATLEEIRSHKYALTPGRYVGSEDAEEDDEPFEEKFPRLVQQLAEQFKKSAELESIIRSNLRSLVPGEPESV